MSLKIPPVNTFIFIVSVVIGVGLFGTMMVLTILSSSPSTMSSPILKYEPESRLSEKYAHLLRLNITRPTGEKQTMYSIFESSPTGAAAYDFFTNVYSKLPLDYLRFACREVDSSLDDLRVIANLLPNFRRAMELIKKPGALSEDEKNFLLNLTLDPNIGLASAVGKRLLAGSEKTADERQAGFDSNVNDILGVHLNALMSCPIANYDINAVLNEFVPACAPEYTKARVTWGQPTAKELVGDDPDFERLGNAAVEQALFPPNLARFAYDTLIEADLKQALMSRDHQKVIEVSAKWMVVTSLKPLLKKPLLIAEAKMVKIKEFMTCVDVDDVQHLGLNHLLDDGERSQWFTDVLAELDSKRKSEMKPLLLTLKITEPVLDSVLNDISNLSTSLPKLILECNKDVPDATVDEKLIQCHHLSENIVRSTTLMYWQDSKTTSASKVKDLKKKINEELKPLLPVGLNNPRFWCFFNSIMVSLASVAYPHLQHWLPSLTGPVDPNPVNAKNEVVVVKDVNDRPLDNDSNTSLFDNFDEIKGKFPVPPDRAIVDFLNTLSRRPGYPLDPPTFDKLNITTFKSLESSPYGPKSARFASGEQQDAQEVLTSLVDPMIGNSILFGNVGVRDSQIGVDAGEDLLTDRFPRVWFVKRVLLSEGTHLLAVKKPIKQVEEFTPKNEESDATKKIVYHLRAAVFKSGSQTGGHYTVFFRQGHRWFEHNDLQVPKIKPATYDAIRGGLIPGTPDTERICTLLTYFRLREDGTDDDTLTPESVDDSSPEPEGGRSSGVGKYGEKLGKEHVYAEEVPFIGTGGKTYIPVKVVNGRVTDAFVLPED